MPHDDVVTAIVSFTEVTFDVAQKTGVKETDFTSVSLTEPRTVKLNRKEGERIGLAIETREEPRLRDFPIVTGMDPGSLAAQSGNIFVGDTVTHVNGRRMAGITQAQLMELFQDNPELELTVVQRTMQDEQPSMPGSRLLTTTLARTSGSLGLEVVTIDGESLPVIKRVVDGSVADQDGVVQRGDRVVAINGTSVAGVAHPDIVQLLVAQDTVELELMRERVTKSIVATIARGSLGYGMKIENDNGVISINEISDGGAVHKDGVLKKGDVLMAINGQTLQGRSHEEVVQLLQASPSTVALEVEREDYPKEVLDMLNEESEEDDIRDVVLVKTNQGLGMSIATMEGIATPVISSLVEGTPAAVHPSVNINDTVLEINGRSTVGMTHDDVVNALKASNEVRLKLQRVDFSEVDVPDANDDGEDHANESGKAAAPADNVRTVVIKRQPNERLGMTILNVEKVPHPIVHQVTEEGLVYQTRQVQPNDLILEINDTSTLNMTHEQTIDLIRKDTQSLRMSLRAASDQEKDLIETHLREEEAAIRAQAQGGSDPRFVDLDRSKGKLGLKIATPTQALNGSLPIITEIYDDGSAAKEPELQLYDCIESINGSSCRGIGHDAVIQLLSATNELRLELRRDPMMLATLAAEATQSSDQIKAADANFENVRAASLQRGTTGLGLEVLTPDSDTFPFVARLVPDGAAVAAGFIRTGDVIIAINNTVVEGMSHAEVVDLLTQGDQLLLRVGSYKLAADQRRVVLPLEDSRELGLKLAMANESEGNVPSVEAVTKGGLADADGTIAVGDLVLRINGQPMSNAESADMVQALQRDSGRLELVLATPAPANTPAAAPEAAINAPADANAESVEPVAAAEPVNGRTVTLDTTNQRLGIRIVTDSDNDTTQILEVMPEGAAAASGQVKAGDVIKQVNGTALIGKSHQEVLSLLSQGPQVTVVLEDGQIPPAAVPATPAAQLQGEHVSVVLDKAAGNGALGLKVETSEHGVSRITGINPGGAAEVNGQLQPGDVIAAVNDMNMIGGSHEQLVQVLGGQQKVSMTVIRPRKTQFGRPVEVVSVQRNEGQSWGLRIVTLGNGLGVVLSGMVKGSPAEAAPGLHPYDVIVSINGQDVLNASHDEIVAILSNNVKVEFEVVHPVAERYTILDSAAGPLGIRIMCDEEDENLRVRISEIIPGGQAEAAAGVRTGDVVVSINHIDVRGRTHAEVVETLQSCKAEVVIGVNSDASPLPKEETDA
eukprot:TRINITY_DN10476_c0_g1_i2.p1 TRINITY_DN10476_c0_g1~~TRINITY_DN10476_c0_g1_i2.p1  ORF type:complete len:1250 (+),score=427.67 TRINITY_DN10476_c0_g1_i2:34-3750(+)